MHELTINLGNDWDLRWAQETVVRDHYLHQSVDPRARPMVYVIRHDGFRYGRIRFKEIRFTFGIAMFAVDRLCVGVRRLTPTYLLGHRYLFHEVS